MKQITSLYEALGVPAIASAVGVTGRMVRKAREEGVLPASWYKPLFEVANAKGVDCPMCIFRWKSPSGALSAGSRPVSAAHSPTAMQSETGAAQDGEAAA